MGILSSRIWARHHTRTLSVHRRRRKSLSLRHGSRVRHIWWSLARIWLSLPALPRRAGHGVTISTDHAGVARHAAGASGAHHVHVVHALLHPGVHVHATHHHGVHVVAHLIRHPHLITKRILNKKNYTMQCTYIN